MRRSLALLLLFAVTLIPALAQGASEQLHFQQFSLSQGLHNGKVHRIMQDHDGFIWIATYHGLFRYDGYDVTAIKSGLLAREQLLHNNVLSLCEDREHRLWIGTQNGLNVLDCSTGELRSLHLPDKPRQRVHDIYCASDGSMYVGYIRGLYRYDAEQDSLMLLSSPYCKGDVPTVVNIQSIAEAPDGDIIISTWMQGLYRYKPSERRFVHYDLPSKTNDGEAQVKMQQLLCHSDGSIWLATIDEGLYRLTFSANGQLISTKQFLHEPGNASSLATNHLLSLAENPIDHSLWIGTRLGISILAVGEKTDEPSFANYSETDAEQFFPAREVNDILSDADGQMWLATEADGVFHTNPFVSRFNVLRMQEAGMSSSNVVNGLCVTPDGAIWVAQGHNVAYHLGDTNLQVNTGPIPNSVSYSPQKGQVLLALRDEGLAICQHGRELHRYTTENCDFLRSNNVTSIAEDEMGNWWIGTQKGLGVRYADGKTYGGSMNNIAEETLFDENINHITSDGKGSIWFSTSSQGIIRLTGDPKTPRAWDCQSYNATNGTSPGNTCIFVFCDRQKRVWAGIEGYGLCLYDELTDTFTSVQQRYNLPGDMVNSMLQDAYGNYWLGTNQGLICLSLQGLEPVSMRIFTEHEGLPSNFFNPGAAFMSGDILYFGSDQGLVWFYPTEPILSPRSVRCLVTDIKINGTSLESLPDEERRKVSTLSVSHTRSITVPARYNNLEITFAAPTFSMPQQNRYAYRLIGFDDNWHYTGADDRHAHYTNLSPGSYTFEVKGANENGDWSEIRQLQVEVSPPWWRSWLAYIIYILIIASVFWFVQRQLNKHISLKNALIMKQIETEKVEELNHVKLQFFSNITHELMTPLSIISASLDEIKEQYAANLQQDASLRELTGTMGVNVQRLMRLLQQILEFRKAETGNLKLRVARADIALFVRHEVESFIPLIRKRQQHISVVCQDQVMMAYFDTDKVDKILYNLLSNAAKYTEAGGAILVDLNYTADKTGIQLVVKDTGRGMSDEQLQGLFRRFYEGDYRQSHTIGTGIGLSLVRDLVQLHRGTITVQSTVDVGTIFTIVLPIEMAAYESEQIIQIDAEEPIQSPQQMMDSQMNDSESDTENEEEALQADAPVILLVEDNDDLLLAMSRSLGREYRILQACNGVEALEYLRNEEVNLVVSDVIMPEMDGMELTRRIKQDIEICHIPVILLTAKRAEEDRDAGYAAGADAYLTKPFSLPAIKTRIQSLLRQRKHMAEDFKQQVNIDTSKLTYTDIDQEFLARAIACVNKHLGDSDFDIVQFAQEMGSSRSSLYKKLRSLTNLNPTSFVRNIRLKAACKVLEENPGVRINELAYSVGFNDPKYFSICFKKEFGMQPTEYSNCFKEKLTNQTNIT